MMNAVIGALRVNLGIDTAQFSDGLKQAQSSADKFASHMKTAFVAAAAAVATTLGAVAAGVKNALSEADEMSKMASKIGIPIEELSKLKYAADLSGVSMEGLKTGVGKLAKNMDDAASGKGPKAFERLGISATDASGKMKTTSQVMAEISDKFANMPDGAQKTALAMQLMGKSGADMIPLLNGGSAALNGMLAEAEALGLEISSNTAAKAEQFNDNLSRMGYAVKGLTLGLTAALAPALAAISDTMVGFVKWILSAVDYLPVLAEYAAVAGGALAVMLSPAIIAAAGNLAVAIGVGLVGAVRLLTAAIAANPLGALVLGITVAVTAIYHFRDEIQNAIGIDVVGIVKDAANFIIGAFVGSFDAIMATWHQLPAALGDLAYQAGYLLADNIRYWINEAILLVSDFIKTINEKLGTEIVRPSTLAPLQNNNPYAGAATGVADAAKAAMSSAMSYDWVAGIGQAFTGSTPAVQDFGAALKDVNSELDEMGGGGGGKGKASKLDKVKDGVKSAAREMERMVDAIAGAMSNAFQGLIDGSKSVKETLADLLKQLSSMLMNEGFKALVGGLFGGGSGGGLFAGIGKLLGFASGGTIMPGGAGGIDSQVVAFRKSPNERVDITKPGQTLHSGGVQEVMIRGVFVDDGGVIKAQVTGMGKQAAQAGAASAVNQVKQSLPAMLANAQTRSM